MKWKVKTDVGVVRSENQDFAGVFEKDGLTLAILCDGMGGHTGGRHASKITVESFSQNFIKNFEKTFTSVQVGDWLIDSLTLSRKKMTAFAKADQTNSGLLDMGTTVTGAIIYEDKFHVFNVGDSRTYVHNGLLHQITRDHNLMNLYIDQFNYTPEQAATVMGATALTSALGPKKKATLDDFVVERDENSRSVVLTSDGIHDYISKPFFEQILSSDDDLDVKGTKLIKSAIKGKSSDNLTVVMVEV